MNLRATIVFSGPSRCAIDHRTIVGLNGTTHVAVACRPVEPHLLKVGDVTFRLDEVADYLTRLTGLNVTIETETV